MKKGEKKIDKLSHEKFAQHYSVYGNSTRAYMQAYPNVAYGTAKTEGSRLLTNVHIQELIQKYKEEFNEKYMHSKEVMIKELENTANEAKALGNYQAYLKAKEMIIKLLDINPQSKLDITSMGKQINISLNLTDDAE